MKTLLFVMGAALAVGQTAGVEGKVVSVTGEGVAKVEVRLQQAQGQLGLPSVATDGEGKFVFEKVAPGRYTLFADKAGFVVEESGGALNLAAGADVKNVVIKMRAQGVISGKVMDQDGDPLRGATVMALKYAYARGAREVRIFGNELTNDRGEYRISGLLPGRYYVAARDDRELREARAAVEIGTVYVTPSKTEANLVTAYPGSLDIEGAKALELSGELRGIDIRLLRSKVYSVKGKAVNAESGAPLAGGYVELVPMSAVSALSVNPLGRIGGTADVQPDGTFQLRNVAPGAFVLSATLNVRGGKRTRFTAGPEITVTSFNVEGLIVSMRPIGPIWGRLTAEDGDLPKRVSLRFLPAVGVNGAPSLAITKDDGAFEFPLAGTVKYWWSVGSLPEGVYVKSTHFRDQDVTRSLLDNLAGLGGDLQIVLSSKAARLSGTAPKGTTVRIWPKIADLGNNAGGMRSVLIDQDGAFQFTGLAPGEYYVAAWKELESGLAESPEFLARFNGDASAVRLDEGGRAAVDVKLIPGERVAAEIARLP